MAQYLSKNIPPLNEPRPPTSYSTLSKRKEKEDLAREELQRHAAGNADLPPLPSDEDIPPKFYNDAQLAFEEE